MTFQSCPELGQEGQQLYPHVNLSLAALERGMTQDRWLSSARTIIPGAGEQGFCPQ